MFGTVGLTDPLRDPSPPLTFLGALLGTWVIAERGRTFFYLSESRALITNFVPIARCVVESLMPPTTACKCVLWLPDIVSTSCLVDFGWNAPNWPNMAQPLESTLPPECLFRTCENNAITSRGPSLAPKSVDVVAPGLRTLKLKRSGPHGIQLWCRGAGLAWSDLLERMANVSHIGFL